MPPGFRWKDQNITEDEYARRRKLIRQLADYVDVGILNTIFGSHEVDHALDEGAKQIGTIPYADPH